MIEFIRNMFTRKFHAARVDRTTADWVVSPIKTNDDIKQNLQMLRERSRDLAKNNSDYGKWLSMRRKNIFGDHGIKLRMKIKNPDGSQDLFANDVIQREWSQWGRYDIGAVSVDGMHSWSSFAEMVDQTYAIDGECIIRKIKGQGAWGFSLQMIDSALLDIGLNIPRSNGQNEIVMGIERNEWGRPVAYYFGDRETGAIQWGGTQHHTRIPADEIYHYFVQTFVGQARGFPPASAAILDMNMTAGYMEAELIAARVAACQMGVWERPANSAGKLKFDNADDDRALMDMEPGKFTIAPRGWSMKALAPTHPGQNLPGFLKAVLRRVSNGLGVSYNDFANDLEGVNFSSLRAGTLSERDGWKMEQSRIIERVYMPIFRDWLAMTLMVGKVSLPLAKLDKFFSPVFTPRRWDWVDPLKDIKAHREAIAARIAAPQEIIEASGRDPEEMIELLKEWQEMIKNGGLLPEQEVKYAEEKDDDDDDE